MKKTSKKIVGAVMVVGLLASIGAIFATADDDGTIDEFIPQDDFWCRPHMDNHGLFNRNITGNGFFYFDLTEK